MGKKRKKKGGTSGKKIKQSSPTTARNNNNNNSVKNKRDSEQTSLYKVYKYCTEAVIQWGKATYKKKKIKTKSNNSNSLSHVIFDILGTLASDGVLMPDQVLSDLKLAISYRKRVGRFYRSLPQVNEEDHARHEWLIQQFEQLAKAFGQNRNSQTKINASNHDGHDSSTMREGFEVLALSDDEEESMASSQDDENAAAKSPAATIMFNTPPTSEELEAEERLFAISLLMYEIDDIRNDLKSRWKDWAQQPLKKDNEAGQELLAMTACTEYALSAVRKSILQVSIEIASFDDFDQIIAGIGESSSSSVMKQTNEQELMKEKDSVTLYNLEKRPDLNGRHGFICNKQLDGGANERLGVQLFPLDAYAATDEKQTLSIKPENLLLSDNTYRRLCQIHKALGSFDFDTIEIPSPPENKYMSSTSTAMQKAGLTIITKWDMFEKAVKNQDFDTLLRLTVQYVVPIWISLTQYLPDVGAADAVLMAYLRDFVKSRTLRFPLAFALLTAMDGALVCAFGRDDLAENTKDLFVRILDQLFTTNDYTPAIRLLEGSKKKANALYSHLEFTKHMRGEYSVSGCFFPLMSGELLLSGLRMHFVCGSGLPYTFAEMYTNVLHIYWMLRSEGYLGRIPELERMIGVYRQQVFFRGGLARRGQETYLKCQQLAHGVSTQALRLIDGRTVARKSGSVPMNKKAMGMDGLHVSEISRLLDVLQWKSMPILDKDACFSEIQTIARAEYATIFTAPLLSVSVKLSRLVNAFGTNLVERARLSGARMLPNFALHTVRMTPCDLVCFWAMALGDDRSVIPGEKEECLTLLARYFARVYDVVEPIVPDEEPTLAFSPNDHTVDSSLWGEKGCRKVEHLQV